nr:hypothetical protein Iba_chr06fCG4370 [Ipomoea batatas]
MKLLLFSLKFLLFPNSFRELSNGFLGKFSPFVAAVELIVPVAGGGGRESLLLVVEIILAGVCVAALHECVTWHRRFLLAAPVVLVFLSRAIVLGDGDVGNRVVVFGEVFLVGNLLVPVREILGGRGGFAAVKTIAAVFRFLHEVGLLFLRV